MPNSTEDRSSAPEPAAHSRFAAFFRSYGLALGVIVAAVPFLAKSLDLLPAFRSFGTILTFATSLISLLTIAFLFGIRRLIGEAVFPPQQTRVLRGTDANRRRRWSVTVPFILATISIVSLVLYLLAVRSSTREVALDRTFVAPRFETSLRDTLQIDKQAVGWLFGDSLTKGFRVTAIADSDNTGRFARITYLMKEAEDSILARTSVSTVPGFLTLMVLYILIFWGAAAAFVWLGLVEYMQRELAIYDADLIRAPYRRMDRETFLVPGLEPDTRSPLVQGLRLPVVFEAEFDPLQPHAQASVFGPKCGGLHGNRPLVYQGLDVESGLHRWACPTPGSTTGETTHLVFLAHGEVGLKQLARAAARDEVKLPDRP